LFTFFGTDEYEQRDMFTVYRKSISSVVPLTRNLLRYLWTKNNFF
jgi:hypothetical protein